MELIPLIYFKNRKILSAKDEGGVSISAFLKRDNNFDKIYILDEDGIRDYKPNLCSYQKLSEKFEMWIDFGPITLGDIVDSFMTGATSITIRKDFWCIPNFSSIKEITENKIYAGIDFIDWTEIGNFFSLLDDVDGLVVFDNKEKEFSNINKSMLVKKVCKKKDVYVYESDFEKISYWDALGVKGILTEINNLRGVEKNAV
ncbi:MAG: hypothetical protein JSW62_05395 [Thermoplasmatales archaeon]|nr:MAG: hypothetical protein JSW62_05395 [Thermoplasmatales archaeon]